MESFMSDVTAALAHGPPQRRRGPEEDEYHEAEFDDFVQYPSDERGNTPAAARSSRRDSVQNLEFVGSYERMHDVDGQSESGDDGPAFLDLGMTNSYGSQRFSALFCSLVFTANLCGFGYEYCNHSIAAAGSFSGIYASREKRAARYWIYF